MATKKFGTRKAFATGTLKHEALPKTRKDSLDSAGKRGERAYRWEESYTGPVYLDWKAPAGKEAR